MRYILTKLLCLVLALSLFAGCGKTANPAVTSAESPIPEETVRPTENQPETEETEPPIPEHADEQPEEDNMNTIQIIVGNTTFTASLYDNEAAHALSAMLPLTLDMSELNGNEKYYYLDEDLPKEAGVPDEIRTGDLMLYGSSCLVLFYETISSSYSYTPLGKLDDPSGLAQAVGSSSVTVTFQFAGEAAPH